MAAILFVLNPLSSMLHPHCHTISSRKPLNTVRCWMTYRLHRQEVALTLKWLGHFFQIVISFSDAVHLMCNIFIWKWSNTMNISSALWILMTWCCSTRASVATVLTTHPCVSWCLRVNSLAPGKFVWTFRFLIFQIISGTDVWGISYQLAFRWMSLDLTDDKSTLVQVMAWCRKATSHYLSQCWPRSLSPYGVDRTQWVNPCWAGLDGKNMKIYFNFYPRPAWTVGIVVPCAVCPSDPVSNHPALVTILQPLIFKAFCSY